MIKVERRVTWIIGLILCPNNIEWNSQASSKRRRKQKNESSYRKGNIVMKILFSASGRKRIKGEMRKEVEPKIERLSLTSLLPVLTALLPLAYFK